MKLKKIFFFTLIFAALVFTISCKGKDDKYADLDDDIVNDDGDTDETDTTPGKDDRDDTGDTTDDGSDTALPDDDTDTDDETDTKSDDDADTGSEIPDGSDTETTEDDMDVDIQDEDHGEFGDEDSISEKEDPEILCSGQTKCYDNYEELPDCPASPKTDFFGQDAQYANKLHCIKKSFSTSDSRVVNDNITELVWQRNLPETYSGCTGSSTGIACTYAEAVKYCEDLEYAGKSDWRLPSPEEFASIKDFGNTPSVDTDIFDLPSSNAKRFWTDTKSLKSSGKSMVVDFVSGSTDPESTSEYFYVRCVRGTTLKKATFTEKEDNDEIFIYDPLNNLEWAKTESYESLNWLNALKHCEDLEYAGKDDWRLPGINELVSILDYTRLRPASLFPDMNSDHYFWSSTSYAGSDNSRAWTISLSDGSVNNQPKNRSKQVICVR